MSDQIGIRYGLIWTDDDAHTWRHAYSFPCVAEARAFAVEHAPDGATGYTIKNIRGSDHTVEGKL